MLNVFDRIETIHKVDDFPGTITNKMPKVETTIFSRLAKLAAEHNAVNLAQGYPDFNSSESLIKLVNQYMKKGFNQYAPMPGAIELREKIAEKTEELYGLSYHPETEITITAGALEAIQGAITALVKEGDEVIVFEPSFDSYHPMVELAGGKVIPLKLKTPGFYIDWEEVKKMVNRKTRMIIINSPHNPSGATLSLQDLNKLEELTRNSDIVVLSDEVYEHIVFDGHQHKSVALCPELASRSFIVSSLGKTLHVTGWRIGYCMAPKRLMAEFRKVHQFTVFSCNHAIQLAIADHLADKSSYLELSRMYQEKRNYFHNLITYSRFKTSPVKGAIFQLLDYSGISDEKDTDFAIRLIKEYGIASVPLSAFYSNLTDNKILRFCFAKRNDTLEKAAEILSSIH